MKKRTKTPQREVLTRKKALAKLALVLKDVDSGELGVRAACRKHDFPLYKYSYWKKYTDEVNALKAEDPTRTEVLVDTSSASPYMNLKRELTEADNKISALIEENRKLREKIVAMLLSSDK